MSNCSKTADEQTASVSSHGMSSFTTNQKTGLVEIGQGNGSLPIPYSPEWQGWPTEGNNFKRCGKCQTRQRNGRGFTCWVRGCGYVFVKTIQNKKPYYCKKNPAPDNIKQIRKELRRKIHNQKRKRAPKTSQKASTSKKARVASDIEPSPPVVTRGDSLTPTGEIESGTPFNYDNIPLDLSLFENNTSSTDEEDANLFEYFLSGIGNSTDV